ncbi:SDR family NAD(P)-dependent oxidoreductase [Asticcacaulis sp. BYS171W]|uniref:SDR family NAD(P)-dependent oxidoreductase n=1 Tax=Asticcacaulis aquaticus TaxID=2984212 RepID=A0ABT5HW74_9CAUL|nr:SDR family NAD(P)-dependent oxidoreductase [Asticcacaulis aquaticus]MDC7684346.1 SDR family NAD(P)-dependent oxidoreductase [Asticcacaulis aquaticus]
MTHPAIVPGTVAVITGAASGIGLAAAQRFAALGLKVVLADIGAARLEAAKAAIWTQTPEADLLAVETDVRDRAAVERLEQAVRVEFGRVDLLMNNAAIGGKSDIFGPLDNWQNVLDANLWGVIHGTQVFAPGMIAQGSPGLIINTGSKQGITLPPGNPAYNVSKAAVKAFTESLEHQLRNTPDCQIRAHLLIPGFVFTGMTGEGAGGNPSAKPDGAWTSQQLIDFMLEEIAKGDFYILCPDNDVSRELDEKRMQWAMGDLIENRPPLSRWHPDYAEAFRAFVDTK